MDEDYPRNLPEFDARFASEEACLECLMRVRWPDGFVCPRCQGREAWTTKRNLLVCGNCEYQTSLTAGTVFEGTRKPLALWFKAMWWVTTQKNGASALGLQRVLGLATYYTAWTWRHKLRRAMVRAGRDRLSGRVEVDESYLGGLEEGVRVRETKKKALVIVAAQEDGKRIGRIRLRRIPDASRASLHGFIRDRVEPGSVGCDGPTAIRMWAKTKEEWLQRLLELPHGTPSRDCIRRVLTALKPEAFQECFASWIASLVNDPANDKPIIAIDGKTMRRSHDHNNGLGPLHLVSAWATERGLSLGQVAAEEKSNEIPAIPELIDQIDVKGAIVTIDAMGCQKDIATKIIDGGGNYVLAVKDNQPQLHGAIREVFSDQRQAELIDSPHRQHETTDNGHGRKDERYYVLAKIPKGFREKDSWPGAAAIGMAVRVTEKADGTMSGDTRYFISSRFLSGERFAQVVRGHWGIENSLHWVLDVTFDEDQSRTRNRRMADNLAWLRRFAISLLKRHPSKDSIKGKCQTAGWNNEFLLEVLTKQGT